MRILLVSQEMPPETGWGGIGTYVDVISEALAAKGHDVHVLSVVDDQSASRADRDGVTVHRCPVLRCPDPFRGRMPETWRRLVLAASVARVVHRLGLAPDVIECPEWMAEGLALGFGEAAPLVVRLHSSAGQIFPVSGQGRRSRGWDGRLAIGLEELAVRRAHVVVSTRSNLEEVAGPLGLDPRALHAISYPVRLPPVAPMDPPAPPRVTFVGRLEPRKAPDVVLRAAPLVLEAVPEAKFVFGGRDVMDPETRPASGWLAREADRLGVAEAIEFTGHLDQAGVQQVLRQATVCAFPSRWESFGLVVAEASAIGRPVVVTRIPPFEELVVDGVTGRLVDAEDTEGWAEALITLLRDRTLGHRMGEAGAAHVAGICDPGHVADLALASYAHARQRWLRRARAGRHLAEPTEAAAGSEPPPPARARFGPELGAPADALTASVILCVRNGAATIAEQLEALATQDYSESWELLVVDNGSTDGTAEVLSRWEGRLPMLRVVQAGDRPGLAYARNAGSEAARGRILAFCDADDIAHPGWLSALAEGTAEADVVGGRLELDRLNGDLSLYWRGLSEGHLGWPYLDHLPYAVGANFAVRRDAFQAVGGCDERFTICGDDVDLSWRIQQAGGSLAFRPDAVMHYRVRQDLRGLMRQRYRYGQAEALVRRKFGAGVPPLPWRVRLRSLWRLLLRSWHLLAGPHRRGAWLATASHLAGQLRGSLRHRVLS